jgi:hypothetical protein
LKNARCPERDLNPGSPAREARAGRERRGKRAQLGGHPRELRERAGGEVGEREGERESGGEVADRDGVRYEAVSAVQHRVAAPVLGVRVFRQSLG